MLVRGTEATTEIEDCIIIFQWQTPQENIQFPETIPDIWRVGFMGFLIGLEQLIQNGFAVAVAGVKGMSFDISL